MSDGTVLGLIPVECFCFDAEDAVAIGTGDQGYL
jgi:hypothetical protein